MLDSGSTSSVTRAPAIPAILTYQALMQFMLTYRRVMAAHGYAHLAPSLHRRLNDVPTSAPPGPLASDDDAQAEAATLLRATFMSENGLKATDSFVAHDQKALNAFLLVLER